MAAGSAGAVWAINIMAWAMGTAFCRWSAGRGRGLAAGTAPMAGVTGVAGAPVPTVGTAATPDSTAVTATVPARRAFRTHSKVTRRTLVQPPDAPS